MEANKAPYKWLQGGIEFVGADDISRNAPGEGNKGSCEGDDERAGDGVCEGVDKGSRGNLQRHTSQYSKITME